MAVVVALAVFIRCLIIKKRCQKRHKNNLMATEASLMSLQTQIHILAWAFTLMVSGQGVVVPVPVLLPGQGLWLSPIRWLVTHSALSTQDFISWPPPRRISRTSTILSKAITPMQRQRYKAILRFPVGTL